MRVASIDPNTLPFLLYLCFKSTCRTLTIDKPIPRLDFCRCMVVSLRDADRHWAGMLRLNLSKSGIVPVGQSFELVAISSGYGENSADKSDYLEE
jgi:hypothetical protein